MRILLVEDETIISLLIEEMLMELGHVVVGPASDVASGLQLCGECDAAILDVTLVGEKVFSVADDLSRRGKPYFFSSGSEDIDPRYNHIPRLTKPFDQEALEHALRLYCSQIG
jgi:DNA-binding response OmpR family regulator